MRTMYFKRVTSHGNVRFVKVVFRRKNLSATKWKNGKYMIENVYNYKMFTPQQYIEHLLDMGYKEI